MKNGELKLSEEMRLVQMTRYESEFWNKGLSVAGMDEVGRGPLAGPVVAACVVMPNDSLICGINDSKKLSEKRRNILFDSIMDKAIAYDFGWVWQDEIDRINILEATKLAFAQAYNNMSFQCDIALVDAVKGININIKQYPIIHGDALSYSIAAASILAKVKRDKYMIEQSKIYPQYGFEKNKGYGTKQHIEAIRQYGLCPLHRLTFVKKILG